MGRSGDCEQTTSPPRSRDVEFVEEFFGKSASLCDNVQIIPLLRAAVSPKESAESLHAIFK
jgi:hypothetical protein